MEPVLETAVEPGGIWWHITRLLHLLLLKIYQALKTHLLPSNPKKDFFLPETLTVKNGFSKLVLKVNLIIFREKGCH